MPHLYFDKGQNMHLGCSYPHLNDCHLSNTFHVQFAEYVIYTDKALGNIFCEIPNTCLF